MSTVSDATRRCVPRACVCHEFSHTGRQRTTYQIVNAHAFTTVNVLAPITSTDAAPNPADTSATFFAFVIAVNRVGWRGKYHRGRRAADGQQRASVTCAFTLTSSRAQITMLKTAAR